MGFSSTEYANRFGRAPGAGAVASASNGRTFIASVDIGAIDSMIDGFEIATMDAVRPAAQAGSQVLYEAVVKNVGQIGAVTGKLSGAIYQAFEKEASTEEIALYRISWNAREAPHGHLVEYGHIQRYAAYVGKDGKWHTAVRPEARGKAKPSRNASQAVKDAYYVPRTGGPAQVPAKSFVRNAATQFPKAYEAATKVLFAPIDKVMA